MKYEEFTFHSFVQGQQIFTRRYLPDGEVQGVLQVTHGMAEHSALYEGFCRYMAEEGFAVTIFDNLGHGRTVASGEDFGYFFEGGLDNVVWDAKKLHDLTAARFPGVPYFIMGHSMGSFIVRDYISKYGEELAGAVIMGTSAGLKPHAWFMQKRILKSAIKTRGPKGRSKTIGDMATDAYNKHFAKPRTPHDWVTSDTKEVDRFVSDPMCGFHLTLSGYLAVGEMLSRINGKDWYQEVPKTLPILMISGAKDPVGDMGKGVRRVAAELVKTEHECELILYPEIRHALVTEINKEQVFADIKSFLQYKAIRAKNKLRAEK